MTSDDILRVLREHSAELQRMGARRLGLFGSFACGEARPDSDVDLLVELDRRTFDRYMDLKLRPRSRFQPAPCGPALRELNAMSRSRQIVEDARFLRLNVI